MRMVLTSLAFAALALGAPCIAQVQERPATFERLPSVSQNALSTWLRRNCNQGVTQRDREALRAVDGDLEALLVEAYRDGPPPALLRRYEAAFAFGEDYESRARMLVQEGARMFGAEETARLQRVDRETYVQRRLEEARINYRTNAVIGLGVVGAHGSLPLLNRVAADASSPMQEAARLSIAALRDGAVTPR